MTLWLKSEDDGMDKEEKGQDSAMNQSTRVINHDLLTKESTIVLW